MFSEPSAFAELTILYLEDEAIIALEMSERLEDLGFAGVLPAYNLAQARRHIEVGLPRLALLDVNLGHGETSLALGAELIAAGVGVVFSTGYSPQNMTFPPGAAAVLGKPIQPGELESALAQAAAGTKDATRDDPPSAAI